MEYIISVLSKKAVSFTQFITGKEPKDSETEEHKGNNFVQNEISDQETEYYVIEYYETEERKTGDPLSTMVSNDPPSTVTKSRNEEDGSKETSSTDNNFQKNSCASDSFQENSCAGESSERCSSADCEQIYTTLPVALNPHGIDYIKMDPGPPNLCTDAGKSLAKEINLSDVSSNANTKDQNCEQRYTTLPVALNPHGIDYIKMDPGPPNLCTDAGKSSAKEINLSDVSSNANTKDQTDEKKLADWKCFSVIDNLSDAEKESFDKKTILPIKFFTRGLPHLAKILDQSDHLDVIVNYFNLEENDRKRILFANYGGGNPGKSLFDHLEHSKPGLTIKELRECLETNFFNSALSFLEDCKYSDKTKVSDINYTHKYTLSYKLFSFNANEKPWKEVAYLLDCSKEDVERITKTIMHPNKYSPTEKLIDILSMQTETTIQGFMDALKQCKMNDAHKIMCQQIIKEIKDNIRKLR